MVGGVKTIFIIVYLPASGSVEAFTQCLSCSESCRPGFRKARSSLKTQYNLVENRETVANIPFDFRAASEIGFLL
jgi:hypothetical protein